MAIARAVEKGEGQPAGIAVDARGGPVFDPSQNVRELNEASVNRQDDLREAAQKLTESRLDHIREVGEIRAGCQKEIGQLRAEHAKELSAAEAGRLNAIRQVDQQNVSTAATSAESAIKALATQAAATADNVQKSLTATAAAIATQFATTVGAITERIAALEKAQYTGQGRSAVSDPAMTEMIAEIKRVAAMQTVVAGQGEGKHAMWGYVVGAAGFVLTLVGIGSALFAFANR